MDKNRLIDIINGYKSKRVLVIGDFFLDLYLIIDPTRTETSLETGLPAYQVASRRFSPGAAGTVAKNLSYLGAEVYTLGFTGDDGNGYDLRGALSQLGVNTDSLFKTNLRATPTYTKPMLSHIDKPEEEMSRLDIKNFTKTPLELEDILLEAIRETVPKMDATLVLDQVTEPDCGVVTSKIRALINELGKKEACPVIYADSRANIHLFENVIIKCNHHEAMRSSAASSLEGCARDLSAKTKRTVFITRGENGMLVCSPTGEELHEVAGIRVEGPVDICGAGDAASAGIVTSLASGATPSEAAMLGNISASVAIKQLGTTGHATPDDMRGVIDKLTL